MLQTLIETLPLGLSLSSLFPSTALSLLYGVTNATSSISISGMYWNLLGLPDQDLYSKHQLEQWGIQHGQDLYSALEEAAERNVSIRILYGASMHTSTEKVYDGKVDFLNNNTLVQNDVPEELYRLTIKYPKTVQVAEWDAKPWYGGGILHQKVWIFDEKEAYLGSANTDWKSLAQVLEVGIWLNGNSQVKSLSMIFERYWQWSSMEIKTEIVYSSTFQAKLQVPCWSMKVSSPVRCVNPFPHKSVDVIRPNALGCEEKQLKPWFIGVAPREIMMGSDERFDEDGLVETIRNAKSFIGLSVMDFQASSVFSTTVQTTPIYWPALTNSLLAVLYAKPVKVQLLISQWKHTSSEMIRGLKALLSSYQVCRKCPGTLEIRLFQIPGWNTTAFPAYTRVSHGKFIVTDTQVNIGTSNMQWGYFYTTAGLSFNSINESLRGDLERLFNRNWESGFTTTL